MKKLFVIGGGMGNMDLTTSQAQKALDACDTLFAFDRMAELFCENYPKIKKCSYKELIPNIEASREDNIGVLVSGDVGFFSASLRLYEALKDSFEIINICGISSMQYLCAKLHLPYENANVISLHGRNSKLSLLSAIAYHETTFVLTGGDNKAGDILRFLSDKIPSDIQVAAGEFLSMENERIVTGSADSLQNYDFDSLTVLVFVNKSFRRAGRTFFDSDFIRGEAPMTKQEVRWVSVKTMDICPQDVIYDIGAGTGSVSIEMASQAHCGTVFAIEKKPDAYSLLQGNIKKHGAYNTTPVFGSASEKIQLLPTPDKVFIGGSGKEMQQLIPELFERNPKLKVVVNAITLETLTETIELFKAMKLSYTVSCINSASNRQINQYNLMTANNPVYIISGEQHD